jgi:hypothetical protein
VALVAAEPMLEVAAPKAEAAVPETVSPKISARCLRTRARSWLSLVPWGTALG